jgi:predicted GNAT family N-acyltransferase
MAETIEEQYNNLLSKWNKNLSKSTVIIKKEIIDIAKTVKAAANGKFAYDLYTKADDTEIINDNVLTYFIKKNAHYDMIKKLSNVDVIIGELNIDENTKDIMYVVPNSGLVDPFKHVVAKLVVLLIDDKPVSMMRIFKEKNLFGEEDVEYINLVITLPEQRRKGYSRLLFLWIFENFKSHLNYALEVDLGKKILIDFYESLGFVKIGMSNYKGTIKKIRINYFFVLVQKSASLCTI